jgi:CheY-like chemotaxis protein
MRAVIRFAFGTGYSSLAYLRRFPIDKLKIDIAFIRDITHNLDAAAIALTIISMAHILKLEVIAEGVETAAHLAYLRRHGCDRIHGYYFSRPLPVTELEQLMQEGRRLPAPDGAASASLKTLLLVDDDVDALARRQDQLGNEGYHILTAQSAADGFEQLAMHRGQVILCDQWLPGVSGMDFFDRIKEMYPDTFQIVMSGHADLESVMDAINHGAIYRFFTKPWEHSALRDSIREAFRHHGFIHDVLHDRRSGNA